MNVREEGGIREKTSERRQDNHVGCVYPKHKTFCWTWVGVRSKEGKEETGFKAE